MNYTSKRLSDADSNQIIQKISNLQNGTIATGGFVHLKVGHKVTRTTVSASPWIEDYREHDVVQTYTGTVAIGLATITGINNTSQLIVGQYVFNNTTTSGFPKNTTIVSIDSDSQVTVSNVSTVAGSNSIQYANLLTRVRLTYDDASKTNLEITERLE